jgi:hypothetical protein
LECHCLEAAAQHAATTAAYNVHGYIALDEGSEESARRAVVHYKKALEMYEGIGNDQGIASAKSNIAVAKSMYEGDNNEEVLKASQELYELRIAEHGDEHEYTIEAGKNYASLPTGAHATGGMMGSS